MERYIHTVEELESLIEEIGFLPLFAGEVAGFSVEERTDPGSWWSGDPDSDPWVWRETIARRGRIAYGKFFDGKAGFLSKRWFPVFANYRRDGYDFDARWDDELASVRQKKIMDLFMNENEDREWLSPELKTKAGFGEGREKNFDGTLTSLQMQTYLVISDFRQRLNQKGQPYGWHIASLSTPEHLFGEEWVRSGYREDPKNSLEKIVSRVKEVCPYASERNILRLAAYSGDRTMTKKGLPYPVNILKAIDKKKDPESWTEDQTDGLYVAMGQLQPKQQRVLWEKYHDGMSYAEIGEGLKRAAGTVGTYHAKAMRRLRNPLAAAWYRDGYAKNLQACAASEKWDIEFSEPGGERIEDYDLCLRIGLKVSLFERLMRDGIVTVRDLRKTVEKGQDWYKDICGVGVKTAEDIERKMRYFGLL